MPWPGGVQGIAWLQRRHSLIGTSGCALTGGLGGLGTKFGLVGMGTALLAGETT